MERPEVEDVYYTSVNIMKLLRYLEEKNPDSDEHVYAKKDLEDHHIGVSNGSKYELVKYWCGYSPDPYENYEAAKADCAEDPEQWDGMGMLAKVVADFILEEDPDFYDWERVVLDVRW